MSVFECKTISENIHKLKQEEYTETSVTPKINNIFIFIYVSTIFQSSSGYNIIIIIIIYY